MNKSGFPVSFLLITFVSMLVGSYSIMLLSISLMYGNTAGFSSFAAGLVSSSFAFASLGSRFFSGYLCDRHSKKTMLVLSGLVFAVCPLAFLGSLPALVLIVVRVIQGSAMGIGSTAVAAMATEQIPRERFTEGIGYFGVGMSASSAIAPGIGLALLGRFGFRGVFLFSSAIGILIVILTLSVPYIAGMSDAKKEKLKDAMFEKTALFASLVTLVISIAQVTVMQFLSYFAAFRGLEGTGLFFPLSTLAIISVRLSMGRLKKFVSDKVLLYTGIGLLTAFYAALRFLPLSAVALAILGVVYGIGHSSSGVVLNSMAIADAPPEKVGAANATYLMASDVAYAVGPLIWNGCSAAFGYSNLFLSVIMLPVAMLMAVIINNNKKERN